MIEKTPLVLHEWLFVRSSNASRIRARHVTDEDVVTTGVRKEAV
jgi:hypothetical protein